MLFSHGVLPQTDLDECLHGVSIASVEVRDEEAEEAVHATRESSRSSQASRPESAAIADLRRVRLRANCVLPVAEAVLPERSQGASIGSSRIGLHGSQPSGRNRLTAAFSPLKAYAGDTGSHMFAVAMAGDGGYSHTAQLDSGNHMMPVMSLR